MVIEANNNQRAVPYLRPNKATISHTTQANLPYSQEAESALLGTLLTDVRNYVIVSALIDAGDFFIPRHQYIYNAISALFEAGQEVDVITVSDKLKSLKQLEDSGGDAYLTHLLTSTETTAHFETYAKIIQKYASRRMILKLGDYIKTLASDEQVETSALIATIGDAVEQTATKLHAHDVLPFGGYLSRIITKIEDAMENPAENIAMPSSLRALDEMMGGYRRNTFYIIGGRTHNGKSTLLYASALASAKSGKKVAIYNTADGNAETVALMLLAIETGISVSALLSGITTMQYRRVLEVAGELSKLEIYIKSDKGLTPRDLYIHARAVKFMHGLDMIFVDYLQGMRAGPNMNDYERISYISEKLTLIMERLNVAMVAAAQINRAGAQGKAPELKHLEGSGKLEQDCQVGIIVHMDALYNPDAPKDKMTIIVEKNKVTGQRGTIHARLNLATTALTEWQKEAEGGRQTDFSEIPR